MLGLRVEAVICGFSANTLPTTIAKKLIGASPRKRHHIRFWGLSLERAEATLNTPAFWLNTDRPPLDQPALWVGAGTRDTGFSLTRFTFQVTHATAPTPTRNGTSSSADSGAWARSARSDGGARATGSKRAASTTM